MKHLLSIALIALAFNLNAQQTEAPEDLINKGNSAVQLKDYKGAFENYQKAFDLYEKQGKAKEIAPETIYNAGYCAHKANLHDEAITYLKKAIEKKNIEFRFSNSPGPRPLIVRADSFSPVFWSKHISRICWSSKR